MKNKIKIAIVAANLELNGISSVIINYCRNINRNKFDITIIAGYPINDILKKECEVLNIPIRKLRNRRKSKIKYYIDLYKNVGKKEFDIFHVNGNSSIMVLELLIAYIKVIKVRIAHSHNTKCTNYKIHNILNPIFQRLYTHAFACGQKAGDWIFKDKEFIIINNGVILEKFIYNKNAREEIRRELKIKDNEFLIGHTGRINSQKNQTFLLEVFEEVCEHFKEKTIKLIFVGKGPLFNLLKEKVSNSKYKDNVILYGETPNPEKFYMAMDLFAFPSKYEGLPVTLVEAQISGLHCIISNEITDEICLTEKVSKLCIDDNRIWINSLIRYIKFYELNMSRKMDINKLKGFDIKNNVDELEKYYYELLRGV